MRCQTGLPEIAKERHSLTDGYLGASCLAYKAPVAQSMVHAEAGFMQIALSEWQLSEPVLSSCRMTYYDHDLSGCTCELTCVQIIVCVSDCRPNVDTCKLAASGGIMTTVLRENQHTIDSSCDTMTRQ